MLVTCANCSAENPDTNRFCDSCGQKLVVKPKEKAAVKAAIVSPARAVRGKEASASPSTLEMAAPGSLGLDKDMLWLFLIIGFGTFLRLWELGLKPLHHDESIHAWNAFQLFKGGSYRYDPGYHGPFRYHFNALMFFVFGVSDFTTRILPVAFGVFVMFFLWQWRGLLGKRGALITIALVAISPTWVYVSRFIRDDIFMAAGSLGICWGLFKYFETLKNKYLYWAVAGLTLSFTSHEGTWILIGVFGSFLMVRWLWEKFGNPVEEENHLSGLFASLALLKSGGPFKQFVAAVFAPITLLLGVFKLVELNQSRRTWTVMLCIFFIPFTLLYSTFFTNMDGWFMGAFDSIAYWLGEQKTGRADRPWQFYIYMLAYYELAIVAFALLGGIRIFFGSGKPQYFWMKVVAFLPFVLAIFLLTMYPKEPRLLPVLSILAVAGAGLAAFSTFAPEKGNFFKVFLIYWAMLGFVMFSVAG
ncbi:MAG: flippase activity-associated protein Agl23, partial [candidate division FCPU426 bacterium]